MATPLASVSAISCSGAWANPSNTVFGLLTMAVFRRSSAPILASRWRLISRVCRALICNDNTWPMVWQAMRSSWGTCNGWRCPQLIKPHSRSPSINEMLMDDSTPMFFMYWQ